MVETNILTLKWGTLKSWSFSSAECQSLLEEWMHFFKNNSKEEILEYLIKYKFPL
jgi:hypothetical protein